MATGLGLGGAAAQGIQSGFEMGRQLDQDAANKAQQARNNARQDQIDTDARTERARTDARQDKADANTEDDRALAAVNSEASDHAITGAGLAHQFGGQDKIPSDQAQAYVAKAQEISARRQALLNKRYAPIVEKEQQWAKDTASRIETGQMSMDDLSPADTVRLIQATSRRPVGDFLAPADGSGKSKIGQAIDDTTAGIQTKNPGLTIQGANVLMGPEVNQGVGHVTSDGSTITGKSLYALLPAPHPPGLQPAQQNPILGLSAMLSQATGAPPPAAPAAGAAPTPSASPNMAAGAAPTPSPGDPNLDGQPGMPTPAGATPPPQGMAGAMAPAPDAGGGDPAAAAPPPAPPLAPGADANRVLPVLQVTAEHPDGTQVTYHAPVTQNRSTDPDDPLHPGIQMSDAMNRMGKMGVLETWANTPAARAKIEQGQKELGGDANSFLTAYAAMHGDAKALLPVGEQDATSQKIRAIKALANSDYGGDFNAAARALDGRGAGGPLEQKLNSIADDPDATDAEKAQARRIAMGIEKVATPKAAKGGSAALGGATAPGGGANDQQTVDFWAKAVIAGDKDWQAGLSRNKSGAALIEAVKRRVPGMATELGLQPQDIGTARATSAALGSTLKDLTKRQAAVELFSNKLTNDMKTYDDLLTKAGSDSPLLVNKPINALRRQFSDPSLAQLDLAAKQVGTEYERLITGGTLSVAQLHAGAAEDAHKLVNGDMPPKQARAVMQTMLKEMGNARNAAQGSVASIQNQIRGLGNGPLGGTPPPAAPAPRATGTGLGAAPAAPKAPPVGTTMQGYRFNGGDPANQANWARVQ